MNMNAIFFLGGIASLLFLLFYFGIKQSKQIAKRLLVYADDNLVRSKDGKVYYWSKLSNTELQEIRGRIRIIILKFPDGIVQVNINSPYFNYIIERLSKRPSSHNRYQK